MKMDIKKLKTIFSNEKFKKIQKFIFLILGYGILINYSLLIIFNTPFKWYGFPAFGIFYYFVMEEFTACFRKLTAKHVQ